VLHDEDLAAAILDLSWNVGGSFISMDPPGEPVI